MLIIYVWESSGSVSVVGLDELLRFGQLRFHGFCWGLVEELRLVLGRDVVVDLVEGRGLV